MAAVSGSGAARGAGRDGFGYTAGMTAWLSVALLAVSAPALADRVIDLSHAYDADTIYWPTESGFVLEKEHDGVTPKGYYYAANRFSSPEHGGTHIDAPVHFAEYRRGVEEAVRSGRADTGRIEFGADGGVARLGLSGGVVLTAAEFKAWGDRALFDVPTGRAEILGPTARTESARGDLAAPHLVYVRSTGVLTATGGVRAVLRQATGDALGGLGWSASEPVQVEAAEATLTDRPPG